MVFLASIALQDTSEARATEDKASYSTVDTGPEAAIDTGRGGGRGDCATQEKSGQGGRQGSVNTSEGVEITISLEYDPERAEAAAEDF